MFRERRIIILFITICVADTNPSRWHAVANYFISFLCCLFWQSDIYLLLLFLLPLLLCQTKQLSRNTFLYIAIKVTVILLCFAIARASNKISCIVIIFQIKYFTIKKNFSFIVTNFFLFSSYLFIIFCY